MRNYKTAFYEPALSDSENVESWEDGGSQDMRMRAHHKWKHMLNTYQAPDIDIAIKEELESFVMMKKQSLPDAWY